MKRLLLAAVIVLMAGNAAAAERRPVQDIDPDALAGDTQVMLPGAGDDHLAMAWWIPLEFWQSILERDMSTSDADKKSILDALSGTSLLAVVQADITAMGAFVFYPKEEVAEKMSISFTGGDGARQSLAPLQKIAPNLEVVLGTLKPVLGAAMGNLGNNMHFYVLSDRSGASGRLLDPYREGRIGLHLVKRSGERIATEIELPVNALFVPRKCPNGKDAHISWKYCPWSGKRLED